MIKSNIVLLYSFLNDEKYTQIVSPAKKKLIWPHMYEWKQLRLCLYLRILKGKNCSLYWITHICVCFGSVILNKSNQKSHQSPVVLCVRVFCNPICLQILLLRGGLGLLQHPRWSTLWKIISLYHFKKWKTSFKKW